MGDYREVIADSGKSDVAGSNRFGMIWQAQLGRLGQIRHDGLREKRGGFNYFGITDFWAYDTARQFDHAFTWAGIRSNSAQQKTIISDRFRR